MKKKAIIVDLDGTLCNNSHRVKFVDGTTYGNVKDWDQFNEQSAFDPENKWCMEIVLAMAAKGYHIIFLTARTGSARVKTITENWLSQNVTLNYSQYTLIMRSEDDFRTDSITKAELYWAQVFPDYDVLFALDDRGRVCDMWRNIGVTALHCEDY